jgi:hypothetical protein
LKSRCEPIATIKACHPEVIPSEDESKQLATLLNQGNAITRWHGRN